MTHTWKDTVATALVAVVVVIYLAYLSFEGIPFVRDVRGMAAVGLVLSIASRRIGGHEGFTHPRVAMAANFGWIALGVVALVTELPAVLATVGALVRRCLASHDRRRPGGVRPSPAQPITLRSRDHAMTDEAPA